MLTALSLFSGLALANGQTTHVHISLHALEHLPAGELRDLLTREDLRDTLVNGTMFPDGGYAVDDNYGELAHWEPFQTAFRDWILENHPPPLDADGERYVAFWMGMASHGMADQVFDATYMERSKVYDAGFGWAEGQSMDTATDVLYASLAGGLTPPERWFPGELFSQLFAGSLGHTVSVETMDEGQNMLGAAIELVALFAEYPEQVETFRAQFPWANAHLRDDTIGNPLCEGEVVAAYWQALWAQLHGDWSFEDPILYALTPDGAMDHPTDHGLVEARVSLVLSRGLDPSTVTAGTVVVTGPDGAVVPTEPHVFYGYSAHIINIHPSQDWAENTDYTVTLMPGITTFDGTTFSAPRSTTFSTRPSPVEEEKEPPPETGRCATGPASGGLLLSLFALLLRRSKASLLHCSIPLALLSGAGCKDRTNDGPLDSGDSTDDSADDSAPVDLDADGATADVDCDDNNAAVYPGAAEVCGDGLVNDCDASPTDAATLCHRMGDLGAADADGVAAGLAQGDSLGWAVAGVGDADGDGLDDLLVGAPNLDDVDQDAGGALLYTGAPSGAMTESARILGERANDYAGFSVAGPGDVNGDGLSDLLIGALYNNRGVRDAGTAYLVYGGASGAASLTDAAAMLTGEAEADGAGYAVAGAGDFNGDGTPDLLIGAFYNDDVASDAGAAYVVFPPVSGEVSLNDAGLSLRGEAQRDWAGAAVAGLGDTDGDGLSDILVGAMNNDATDTNAGAAYLVLGGATGNVSLADADLVLPGLAYGDFAGTAVSAAGDNDGDGYADALIGAPREDTGADAAGMVYLMRGPLAGGLGDAVATFSGENAEDYAGQAVAGADLDMDGLGDILVGAPYHNEQGSDAGRVYVLYGPQSGAQSLASAPLTLTGAGGDQLGSAVAGAGDTDGDGVGDILAGAYRADTTTEDVGAALLFLGSSY